VHPPQEARSMSDRYLNWPTGDDLIDETFPLTTEVDDRGFVIGVCARCGAVVLNQTKAQHARWHRRRWWKAA
jgi:hypothetical protein